MNITFNQSLKDKVEIINNLSCDIYYCNKKNLILFYNNSMPQNIKDGINKAINCMESLKPLYEFYIEGKCSLADKLNSSLVEYENILDEYIKELTEIKKTIYCEQSYLRKRKIK